MAPPPPPGINASTSTPMAILIAVSMEAIVIPCSLTEFESFQPMPTTIAHRFCNTQPTTSLALLRIQLTIPPMTPSNASAALIPNWPKSDDNALSLFLIHSFRPASSLGGSPPPDVVAPPPPGNIASTSTLMAILIAVSMEAIVIPCSLNRVRIFSANEVSLSNTLAISIES